MRSDSNTLELARTNFPERGDKTLAFEPMGRRAYRVLLLRPTHERPFFQVLTVSFVVLFTLAAVGIAWDARKIRGPVFRRRGPGAQGPVAEPGAGFPHARDFSGRA